MRAVIFLLVNFSRFSNTLLLTRELDFEKRDSNEDEPYMKIPYLIMKAARKGKSLIAGRSDN